MGKPAGNAQNNDGPSGNQFEDGGNMRGMTGAQSNFEGSPQEPQPKKASGALSSKPFTLKKGSIAKRPDPALQ